MFTNIKILLFFVILSQSIIINNLKAASYNISHIEPLSWWTNMHSNKLQLMVHGNNIAQLTPKTSSNDLRIVKVHKAKNPNYIFIDLVLSEQLKPGIYPLDFYQNNSKVLTKDYIIQAKNDNHAANNSFTPKDVIYLITPDRFANGDLNNDTSEVLTEGLARNKKGGRHGGDIQGIINNLSYLKNMGFTQIWTNPMIENNQSSYSYHGYSTTDFYQIDARFGDNNLYKELSKQAQSQGIGLIKDVVLNHIGSKHWWMNDLPMQNWLNFQETANNKDTFIGTHHKRESLHDPHATKKDITLFTDGWFVPSMPDLNQRNQFVSTYLTQNTLWWIEFANLSGVRVDTYSYSDRHFLTHWTKRLTDEYPNINIVGEEWTTSPAHVAYWQRGKNNADGYQSYLPSVMDFPLQDALINGLKNKEDWNSGLNQLYQALANDFQYADPYNLVTFADNHDMSRIFTQVDHDMSTYKMAMTYLLTTRGIPQVFYGTEIVMSNPKTDDHGIIRSDFPGGWENDNTNAFTGKNLNKEQQNAQLFIKTLLNWRKNAIAIHQGKLIHFAPNKGVYVYFRVLEGSVAKNASKSVSTKTNAQTNNVMVIINKNSDEVSINPSDFAEVIMQGKVIDKHSTSKLNGKKAINILSDKVISLAHPIKVKGKTASVFSLTR